MIDMNGFLMIEPCGPVEPSVRDALTVATEAAILSARLGERYRGFHVCCCGARSDNGERFIQIGSRQYLTNSLAAHYMEFHRSEVPARDIELVRSIVGDV